VEPPEFDERWAVLLLDDVHLYSAVQQHAAFAWFVQAQTLQRGVLAAGALPPAAEEHGIDPTLVDERASTWCTR
jgi:DnaA family protein